jgi:hypothetical protein
VLRRGPCRIADVDRHLDGHVHLHRGGRAPPAKNEIIVYRFVRRDAQHAILYADKIVAGKREAMGALDMQLSAGDRQASKHFTHGNTSGTWAYTMLSDSALTGTLIVDPGNTLARKVEAHRVEDKDMLPAPALGDYGTPD